MGIYEVDKLSTALKKYAVVFAVGLFVGGIGGYKVNDWFHERGRTISDRLERYDRTLDSIIRDEKTGIDQRRPRTEWKEKMEYP